MADTPYVIVVHGTWNPPRAEQRQWYQRSEDDPGNFCTQLNDRLEQLGLGRPVWRTVAGRTLEFHWSGANEHDARIEAGKKLHALILRILDFDHTGRIHLVAHSHGGNVALKAIQLYLDDLGSLGAVAPDWPDVQDYLNDVRSFGWFAPADWPFPLDESSWERLLKYWGWGAVSPTLEQAAPVLAQLAAGEAASREAFMADWLTDPGVNRLGRVVFLGTPFYWKLWHRRGWAARRLRRLLDVSLNVLVLSAFLYLFAFLTHFMSALEQALGRDLGRPIPLNPLAWTWWGWTIFLGIVLPLAWWAKPRFPRDGNVYFDEERLSTVDLTKASGAPGAAVDALVIEAGPLDEALLALSSEPLVYGALVPRVRDLLGARYGLLPAAPPVGVHHDIDDPLRLRYTLKRALLLVRRAAAALCTPVLGPARKLLEGYLTATLTTLVSATGCGLRPIEFKGARVVVRTTPGVSPLIREHTWCVAQALLSEPPAAADPSAPGANASSEPAAAVERYAFLWDPDLLVEKSRQSRIWHHLSSSLPHMRRRYGSEDAGDGTWVRHVADLQLVSLTLEERLRELAGLVELAHSQYYSNHLVIDAIAQFIATGAPPATRVT